MPLTSLPRGMSDDFRPVLDGIHHHWPLGHGLLLLWAFHKKQFKESDRAALLALSDLETENEPPPAMRMSRELAVLIGVFGVGIFVMAASIVVSIMVAEP